MKVSVSIPEEDVRFLDEYARGQDTPWRVQVFVLPQQSAAHHVMVMTCGHTPLVVALRMPE